MSKLKNLFSAFGEQRMIVALMLGFSSGLPLLLSSSSLQAWFNEYRLSLKDLGLVTLAALPYNFKFVWAPLMDRWVPPLFGRRRGWILISQLCLCLTIGGMALFSPDKHLQFIFILACLVAFFSASQDIAINAYTTDILPEKERGLGAAMYVNGYRTAMLIAGGGVLMIAQFWGFRNAYFLMAALMTVGVIAALRGPDPEVKIAPPAHLWDCTVLPFIDFLKRPQAIWILILILFYKLGDAYGGALSQIFLLREMKFSLVEVGTLIKFSGFFGTIFGTTVGALLIPKLGWVRSLFWFGVVQAISNLSYLALLWTGQNYLAVSTSVFVENFCGGMGTAAFTGFLMGLCNPRFTAFQFALLSSLSSVGRTVTGVPAGYVAHEYGWVVYFVSSLIVSAPGILLLPALKRGIERMTEAQSKVKADLQLTPASSQA